MTSWTLTLGLVVSAASTPETPVVLRGLLENHARASRIGGEGSGAIEVTFLPAEWPNLTIQGPAPGDWSRFHSLLLDVENPGRRAVAFGVRVDDDPASDGLTHCRTAEGTIGPGASETIAVDFGSARDLGMIGLPGRPRARSLRASGQGAFDPSHVVAFQVFLHKPETPRTLRIKNVRLAPLASLEKLVDRFGQSTRGSWPGKVATEADLSSRLEAERRDLEAHPGPPDRDRFGGWEAGPRLTASGFFRTAKVAGAWWLVDPDGRLFFSSGMDEVRPDLPTFVTGRASLFAELPEARNPLARYFGTTKNVHSGPTGEGRTFDFYGANLVRKYGPRAVERWKGVTLSRLRSWGFNTLGNWSDGFYRNGRVPYVASATIHGDHARISSGSDVWGKMHDPFDPRFAVNVARSLHDVVLEVKGDPWCVGYFVDNELSWGEPDEGLGRYGLALGTLSQGPRSPAKAAFLAQLRAKYGAVDKLNAAWGARLESWETLAESFRPPRPPTAMLKEDLSAFSRAFARRYFATVRERLRRLDPDHLYLGCRFASRTPEAVEAAAESADIVSFNIYKPRIDPKEWAFLNALGRPAIIGEFHFGALDRGMFHPGLVPAANQEGRARMFREYVESVVDHRAIVGCHWFEYVDEPVTGRTFDGENYNIGFVSVTDTPYPELVASARGVHHALYPRRRDHAPGTDKAAP